MALISEYCRRGEHRKCDNPRCDCRTGEHADGHSNGPQIIYGPVAFLAISHDNVTWTDLGSGRQFRGTE